MKSDRYFGQYILNALRFITVDDDRPSIDAYKLSTVRMKLEEKRRQIEQDKRKMEVNLNRHQQKVGKAAFLQAINKVCAILLKIIFMKIES